MIAQSLLEESPMSSRLSPSNENGLFSEKLYEKTSLVPPEDI
jgi:hypothetical protein